MRIPRIANTEYENLEAAFKAKMNEVIDLVECYVDTMTETKADRQTWINRCWDDYHEDIEEYLWGLIDYDGDNDSNEVLARKVTLYDLCDAIKANSESFFGWDITEYLEK